MYFIWFYFIHHSHHSHSCSGVCLIPFIFGFGGSFMYKSAKTKNHEWLRRLNFIRALNIQFASNLLIRNKWTIEWPFMLILQYRTLLHVLLLIFRSILKTGYLMDCVVQPLFHSFHFWCFV